MRSHRPPVVVALARGQPDQAGYEVYGEFGNDDRPLVVSVEWEGFSIVAGRDSFDMGDQENGKECEHFTLDQWESLKNLVTSGVIDRALYFGKAWQAQRDEPENTDLIIQILSALDGGE